MFEHRPRHLSVAAATTNEGERSRLGRGLATAVVAGLAWTVSLPPFGWWFLAPVAVALLAVASDGQPVARRFLVGMVAGGVVFGVTLRWATIFTVPGYVVLVAVQALFVGAALAAVPRGRGRLLALPGAVGLAEWMRHAWPLSGLPLSGLDMSQAPGPLLALTGLGGPLLVVIGVAAAGCLVAAAWHATNIRVRAAELVGAGSLVGLAGLVPTGINTAVEGAPVTVAAVQGGGPRGIPAVVSSDEQVFARHVSASETMDDPVDLIVWPEDVVDVVGAFPDSPQREVLSSLVREHDATLVAGVVQDAEPDDGSGIRRFRNLAVAIAPNGDISDTSDKVIRVPFGEYVPWRGLVDRFADLSLIPREAVAGTGPGVLDTELGRIGVSISFEGLFAERSRAAVRAGAQLLVNPTNAASYVTPDVPSQQVAAGRMRAVESGRWVVVAGPTGPSAFIDPAGTVRDISALEQPVVLQRTVERRRGLTPYGQGGDLPAVVLAVTMLAAGWVMALLQRHARGQPPADWRNGAGDSSP